MLKGLKLFIHLEHINGSIKSTINLLIYYNYGAVII